MQPSFYGKSIWQKLNKCARIYFPSFQHYRADVSDIHEAKKVPKDLDSATAATN